MKHLMYLIALLFLVACDSSHEISKKIKEMESAPVTIDYSSMSCWINDSLITEKPWESEKGMKLISFVDSSLCSECNIKKLAIWNDIIELEQQYEGFNVVFILGVKEGMTSYISTQLHLSGISHPIYLDETQSVLTKNPHIPQESMYHTFLLDEKNNVVMVGSPVEGENIEKIMLKVLDSRLKKRKGSEQ